MQNLRNKVLKVLYHFQIQAVGYVVLMSLQNWYVKRISSHMPGPHQSLQCIRLGPAQYIHSVQVKHMLAPAQCIPA